ncbi:hypothetical protein DMW99_01870 [Pseudomonas chlororaphis]|nr:hypothetical protein C1Y36_28415 [Pseudomonas sp. FW306-2-2C-D06C]PYC42129.1 hypothetical protein DMW99_01870 [Pseudomonas chlororaphis]
MVVDSNQLQSPQLRTFLEASTVNRAVLTDYSAMEALQGDAVQSICNAMRILGDYPKQVIVLRHTQMICQLSGRAAGLQRRMIHTGQTAGFPEYIRKLNAAERGDLPLIEEIRKMAVDANQQLHRMLGDALELAQSFDSLAVDFDKEERRKIRDGEPYTAKMVDTLIKAVMQVSITLFRTHPRSPRVPIYRELPNTFIFRNALCCYLLALEWAASGGAKTAKDHKIRNDMVDSHFVTHATYFDGLLTEDAKAMRLYKRAKEILSTAFG